MGLIYYIAQVQFDFGAIALARSECERADHSPSHALGAPPVSLHHGTLNAVLLPEVVKFNEAVVPDKVQAIADVFGARGRAAPAISIRDLNRRLGLPSGLGAMGVGPESYEDIAAHALKDHGHAANQRSSSHADYIAMLAASSSAD